MLRIHDILVWIRIRTRGSMPLTNGSGYGFIDLQDANKKLIFKNKFFFVILFEGTFASFFKDKKSKRSHKSHKTVEIKVVEIKVFLTFFS
jgi:hypothetical protein